MMNINNLLIKTKIVEFYWIPLLFGLYNVFDCLHKLNNYYKKKITKLQVLLNDTNKKHNELQQKYNQLYAEFQELNLKFNNLNNKEINELTIETETVALDETVKPSIVLLRSALLLIVPLFIKVTSLKSCSVLLIVRV